MYLPVLRDWGLSLRSSTEEDTQQYMAQMDSWSVGGEVADYNFAAALPEGVKQVEFNLKTAD